MKIIYVTLLLVCQNLVAAETSETLQNFELQDQFKNVYTKASLKEPTVIFVVADRKGSGYCGEDDALKTMIDMTENPDNFLPVSVATLKGVPRIIRGAMRAMMPDDKDKWMLMDWDGIFKQQYQLADDTCTILIFNQDRKLVFRQAFTQPSENPFTHIPDVLNETL